MPRNALGKIHHPALDGMRGIAIILVVLYHNFGFINYFFFGWLGVDIFFVLSGFLITNILLEKRDEINYLRNFYMRRLLRIAPLYYLALAIFLLILPRLTHTINFGYYTEHQWYFWAYLQNWLLINPESSKNSTAMHHFWSLAVEEQFYILWPWVIFIINKPRYLIRFLVTLIILVIAMRTSMWLYRIKDFNYYGFYTFTRIDGLCTGSLLAAFQFISSKFLRRYSVAIILSLVALNLLFLFLNLSKKIPYFATIGYLTFAIIFALIISEAINQHHKPVSLILQNPLLIFFGKISYGLYIFHWPVYVLFHSYVNDRLIQYFSLSSSITDILTAIITTCLGIGLSVLSFNFFENHFLKLKKHFT